MQEEIPYHFLVFQTAAKQLRSDPNGVVTRLTEWLSDTNSPRFWAPFAYSIRGLAYEYLSDWRMAKHDYAAGMRIYEELEGQHGKEKMARVEHNAKFMLSRKNSLPPVPPTPKPEIKTIYNYVLLVGGPETPALINVV